MTRIDGYAELDPRHGAPDAPPGASFHVIDGVNGSIVATHRTEEIATGLPHHVRVNIAEWRANHDADGRERIAQELPEA